MPLDIEALRKAFKTKSEGSSEGNTGFWDKFYPFYKIDFDQSVKFRFLPDKDESNPLGFIIPNQYHELNVNGQRKKLACLKMYDESCPCCEASQRYYGEGDEKTGKMFWRKIDYIAQGVLTAGSPFDYPIKPDENPVRLVSIGTKLYKVIEAQIVKSDMDELPTDLMKGYDFTISKTKQGEYADYTTSSFARKSTPIADELLAKIDLYDLKNFRYGKIEREQMEAMIEAALTGKSYDDGKQREASHSSSESSSAPSTGSTSVDAKLETAADPAKKLSPAEILKRLREQQGK